MIAFINDNNLCTDFYVENSGVFSLLISPAYGAENKTGANTNFPKAHTEPLNVLLMR